MLLLLLWHWKTVFVGGYDGGGDEVAVGHYYRKGVLFLECHYFGGPNLVAHFVEGEYFVEENSTKCLSEKHHFGGSNSYLMIEFQDHWWEAYCCWWWSKMWFAEQ